MFDRHDNRRRRATVAIALALAATAVPAAAAQEFIPGVTDFPSRPAYIQHDEFVPGVTDFPSRRAYVEPGWIPHLSAEQPLVAVADPFDWADAGIGAAAALAATLMAGAASLAAARTRRLRHG